MLVNDNLGIGIQHENKYPLTTMEIVPWQPFIAIKFMRNYKICKQGICHQILEFTSKASTT